MARHGTTPCGVVWCGVVWCVVSQADFHIDKMRPTTATNPTKPTMCDPKLRTINTNAVCGAPDDFWHYTPWR